MAEETERIYVIPLKKKSFNHSRAAPTAIKKVKQYLMRHMHAEEDDIWIDDSLNHEIWSNGKYKMPTKIRVKAVKFEDGVVEAYKPELEFKKSRREILKEEREKKTETPVLRKEEIPEPSEEAPEGAEDYEIAPAADGDVKIKKKKTSKGEEENAEEKQSEKTDEKTSEKKEKKEDKKTQESAEEKPEERQKEDTKDKKNKK